MADVTTTFAAKDESFAKTVDKLSGRLQGFQSETASFSEKVGGMASAFARFAGPIAAMGAAVLGARGAVDSFREAINLGGQLDDLTKRTGMAAGEVLVLQEAFRLGGSSADAVAPTIDRLRKAIVAAGDGSGEQAIAFAKLGINMEAIKNASPTEQLEMLAKGLNGVASDTDRSALAMQILGRSGGELLPVLRNFAGEVDKARGYLGSLPDSMNQGAEALADLGDNFDAIGRKVNQFVAGALVEIAPAIKRATDELAKMDFAAMGQSLMQTLQRAYDFFRGLWANPSQLFGLIGDYLNATFRQAGDSLLSAFLTAGNALADFLNELVTRGAFTKLGEVLANAFVYGTQRFNLLMFDAIQSAIDFFGRLWDSATGQGVRGLAQKLFDVVKFFASDFVQAMTNPLGFIGNKIGSALVKATTEAADDYRSAYDSATGSYIEKARAGLQSVVDGSGASLKQSAGEFGNILVDSSKAAAANAKIVEVNLFGGAEAVKQVNERVAAIAEAGAKFRTPMEESVAPAEQIKGAIADIPASGRGLKEVLNDAFPLAAAIKDEARTMHAEGRGFSAAVNAAKIDAKITSDLFTGLSARFNTAANAVNSTLDKMREAFHFGQNTAKEIYEQARKSGMSIYDSTQKASTHMAKQNELASEMQRFEQKERLIENKRDREYNRAAKKEERGQDNAANNIRRRADAEATKELEKLRKESAEKVKELAEEGGNAVRDAGGEVKDGGESAEAAMTKGGQAAGQAIEAAADALKNAVTQDKQALALEATLQACRNFLASIDDKLPQ